MHSGQAGRVALRPKNAICSKTSVSVKDCPKLSSLKDKSKPMRPISKQPLKGVSKTASKYLRSKETERAIPKLGRMLDAPGFLLRKANIVFRLHYMEYFKDSGLEVTPVMGGMLILISENPGINQIELARLLKIEGSTLWQTISRLVELGYVDRKRVPTDRRAFALNTSKRGQAALDEIESGMARHQKALMSILTSDERKLFVDILQRLIRHGEKNLGIE